MKTFKDLKFKNSHLTNEKKIAQMFFDNGYGISVVTGANTYTSEEKPYEVAVLIGNKEDFELCYYTHIIDDIIGYFDEEGVTRIMLEIQKL